MDYETKFNAMLEDFKKCAKGVSPCFFCNKDEACSGDPKECDFEWYEHKGE